MRETFADFHALDTVPYGVNEATAASHLHFIEELKLPFDLLVDEGLAVATTYGALKPEGTGIMRTVVMVGRNGKIIFRAQGAPPPAELLAALATADDI